MTTKKYFLLRPTVFLFIVYFLSVSATSAQSVYGGIKLLDGYKYKTGKAVDAITGTIYKQNGLTIDFEAGFSQGYAADKKNKEQYEWYKEQTINGRTIRIAYIKPNLKTVWEPDQPRSPEPGSIMLVTIPLGNERNNAVNFRAEILSLQEATDFLLMVLTFDETK